MPRLDRDIPKYCNDWEVPRSYEECRRQWAYAMHAISGLKVLIDGRAKGPHCKTRWKCMLLQHRWWQANVLVDEMERMRLDGQPCIRTEAQRRKGLHRPATLDDMYKWEDAPDA